MRRVTSDFKIQKDFLSMESMHETSRGGDLFEKLLLAMGKFNLPFEKLGGIAIDGASAMVGSQMEINSTF